jgi:hypothetical protein
MCARSVPKVKIPVKLVAPLPPKEPGLPVVRDRVCSRCAHVVWRVIALFAMITHVVADAE